MAQGVNLEDQGSIEAVHIQHVKNMDVFWCSKWNIIHVSTVLSNKCMYNYLSKYKQICILNGVLY